MIPVESHLLFVKSFGKRAIFFNFAVLKRK